MSTQHGTMETTIKSAGATQQASLATALTTHQTTIDVAKSAVGYMPGLRGTESTYQAAVAAATKQLGIDRANAEAIKQTSMAVARDVMRNANTGEVQ